MKTRHKEKLILLFFIDLVAMIMALIVGFLFGHRPPVSFALFSHYQWGIFTLFGTTLVLFIILDVYSFHKTSTRFLNQVLVIGIALLLSGVVTTFLFFFFRNPVPRAVFILFFIFSWLLISIFRMLHNVITLKSIYWKILLVGNPSPGAEVAALIKNRPYLHSRIVGFLSDDLPEQSCADLPFLGSTNKLLEFAFRDQIDQVIVATEHMSTDLMRDLMECMKRTIKVSDFRDIIEMISGKIPIDYLSDTWFLHEFNNSDMRLFWYVKRSIDIVMSLFGSLIALLFLPLIAVMIRIDSQGPVFYSQTRIGRGNKQFRLWKLRTMVLDADKSNVFWTMDKDSRITRIGKYLRMVRFDEVPQLINILKGEMSLIGPRPEAEALVELYAKEIPYYGARNMVTPGITGWAQINYSYGNSVEDAREKLKYDFYYIKNRSLLLDMLILLRTIRIVLTGKGAL